MIKKIALIFFFLLIFLAIAISGIKLLSHPSVEFDEGVYMTTFQVVNKGYSLYNPTFFSQPPGFYFLTNPIFKLFGQTLESGRLAIFLWSLIGIIGILWIGFEVEAIFFSIIAIGILYLIPLYSSEILTFHADSLILVFSTLSLAAFLRFKNTFSLKQILLSSFFLSLSILVKLDFLILIPNIVTIFFITKEGIISKKHLQKVYLLWISSLLIFISIFTLPFGIKNIINNVLGLRLEAISYFPFNPLSIYNYLITEKLLFVIIVLGILLSIFTVYKKIHNYKISLIFLTWVITSLVVLFIYHPLFLHHLVFLTISSSALLAYSLYILIKIKFSKKHLSLLIIIFIFLVSFFRLSYAFSKNTEILNNEEKKGIQIILTNTNKNDFVVSDDGLLNGISQRLAPPNLVDLSYVRINTGNLKTSDFEKSINLFSPKLIMFWNGRLQNLANINYILQKYNYQKIYDNKSQRAYMHKI